MKKIQGFTLSEVLIVVAVLAVVFTLAMPDVSRLFDRQNKVIDSGRLKEIRESLELYAKHNKQLPSVADWYTDLADYTELSIDEVRYDIWGNERRYTRHSKTNSYMGSNYTSYYVTVTSPGVGGTFESTAPTNVATFGTFNVDSNIFDDADADMAVKYTDRSYKIELVDITIERIDKLTSALEKYATVKQIEHISTNPSNSNAPYTLIHFSKNGIGGSMGDLNNFYYNPTNNTSSNGVYILDSNKADDLAVFLGLPAEYGRNALTNQALYYISNPGSDATNPCTGARTNAPFYPPLIVLNSGGC